MKKLAACSTSVLVTVGLIIYLEAIPISANNSTRNERKEKLQARQFWKKVRKEFFKDKLTSKFNSYLDRLSF